MNRYQLIVILFLSVLFSNSFAQSGLRPAGRYEIADTTIEVYNVGEFNTIREFKTIHGTNIIKYREFNKLTKKLREEGMFKNGYSSGVWKFYGWTGRLKREVNYEGQVKTYYVKRESDIEVMDGQAAMFDFEKFKQDSAFVANYRKNKGGAVEATNKPKPVEPTNGVTIGTVNINTVNIGSEQKKEIVAAGSVATGSDSTKQKVEGTDSTKQKTITGVLAKLNIFKKPDTKKEEVKIAASDSVASKPVPVVVSKPAEPKKENTVAAKSAPASSKTAETKPAPAVASKPAEPKKETPASTEKKPSPAVVSKPAEPKKEAPAEIKPAPAIASKPTEPKKEQVLTGSMDQGSNKAKNNSTNSATNKTSQKTGGSKQVNNTVNVTKPAVTVENKPQKTAVDTASKKMDDALTKKWLALKKENDRMEKELKSHKRDSLHTDSIKRGLIKAPLEQKEKTSSAGTSK